MKSFDATIRDKLANEEPTFMPDCDIRRSQAAEGTREQQCDCCWMLLSPRAISQNSTHIPCAAHTFRYGMHGCQRKHTRISCYPNTPCMLACCVVSRARERYTEPIESKTVMASYCTPWRDFFLEL